jgi:hypothetical protein
MKVLAVLKRKVVLASDSTSTGSPVVLASRSTPSTSTISMVLVLVLVLVVVLVRSTGQEVGSPSTVTTVTYSVPVLVPDYQLPVLHLCISTRPYH